MSVSPHTQRVATKMFVNRLNLQNRFPWLPKKKPKRVLVIGSSTGYGLASRISAAFSAGADTLEFILKDHLPGKEQRVLVLQFEAFSKLAREAGLKAEDVNGDAFSDEIKKKLLPRLRSLADSLILLYTAPLPVGRIQKMELHTVHV